MKEPERFDAVMEDGARIACRVYGGGERALLFLHGNGEDYTCFREQLPFFAEHFRVVAMDSRGHGASTAGDGISIARIARDADAALTALGIGRASVVGFSDGANAAIALALEHPDRVEKLVLAGANLFPAGVRARYQLPVELEYRARRLWDRLRKRPGRRTELLGLMVEEPRYTPELLAGIKAPTLVLAGDRDLIRPAHTALIASSIPGALRKTVPDSDHWIFSRRPALVNRLVAEFLG